MRWIMVVVVVALGSVACVGRASTGSGRSTKPIVQAGAGVGPAQPCTWRVGSSPNPGPGEHSLVAVAGDSNRDVWALGGYYSGQESGPTGNIVLHWNGVAWRVAPDAGLDQHAQLRNLAVVAPNDVWAVGDGHRHALIERWDGHEWRRVPSPDTGGSSSNLLAVTAVSARDVWAVGGYVVGNAGRALVEHWDGAEWRIVPSPSPPPRPLTARPYDSLDALAASSPSDVWAVGEVTNVAPEGASNTLIEHWDGKHWAVVASPNVAANGGLPYDHLFSVAAMSPSDAWAVGAWDTTPGFGGGGDHALIERWNGRRWAVSPPFGLRARNYLQAVTARSATDAWAMGDEGIQNRRVLLAHWDGSRWKTALGGDGSIAAATELRSGGVAVGSTDTPARTLALRCTQ